MNSLQPVDLAAAYEHCRQIAKREAKNFYYAFRVLPRHKSDAMCAVYAFMRKADDLADDESHSVLQRREMMSAWTADWRASRTTATTDPVFVALRNTQERFGISDELLEELVAGTTLDLYGGEAGVESLALVKDESGQAATVQVYRTFDDLYRYCYLVASVVGLVCIKIFGYTDSQAEQYAEHVGVAFQLTNVLRDVVEDAQRGRIYLPLDDMSDAEIAPAALVEATASGKASQGVLRVLEKEIARAEDYYHSVEKLVPLLDADSRAAMEVLATIYRELLQLIAADPARVLRGRISVPTTRKLMILAGGLLRSQFARGRA